MSNVTNTNSTIPSVIVEASEKDQFNGVDEKMIYEDITNGLNSCYTRVRENHDDKNSYYFCSICHKIFDDKKRHDLVKGHTFTFHICNTNKQLPEKVTNHWKVMILSKPEKWYIYLQYLLKEFISSQSKVTISESGKVLKRRKTEAIKPKPITDMFRLSKISPLLSIKYKINTTLRRMLSGILFSSLFGSEDAT